MVQIPPNPSKEEIYLLRETVTKKIEDEGKIDSVDQRDLNRIKSDDDYVRRFLMHHDNVQHLALDMVMETLKWRKENAVNDITEDLLDNYLLEKKILMMHNRDIDGCKMLIFTVKNYVMKELDPERVRQLLIYWIERLEREEEGKWITVFFDMKDTGFKNMDMDFIQYFINLFKSYYPWILNYIIVFEMPWLLNALWKIIKGWLPPKSIDKIKFLDKKTLVTYVPEDQMLVSWGGTDDYVFKFEPEQIEKSDNVNDMNGDGGNRKVHFVEKLQMLSNDTNHVDAEQNLVISECMKFQVHPNEELVFDSNRIGAISTIQLTNNCADVRYAFKIKTTSPEKYRVRPSVGTVPPLGKVEVTVTLNDKVTPSLFVRDKFLILALPVFTMENINQQEFTELHKNTNKLDITEVRLRVGMEVSETIESQSSKESSPVAVSPLLVSKLDALMMRQFVMEEQMKSLRRLLYLIFFMMIAIMFVFVFTTNNLTSSLLAQTKPMPMYKEL